MKLTVDCIEFDEVFTISLHNSIPEILVSETGNYAPDVLIEDDEVIVEGAWTIVHGLSNQAGIQNGILHPSETMSEQVIAKLFETYGADRDFALTEVVNMDDMDELIGWVVVVKN